MKQYLTKERRPACYFEYRQENAHQSEWPAPEGAFGHAASSALVILMINSALPPSPHMPKQVRYL